MHVEGAVITSSSARFPFHNSITSIGTIVYVHRAARQMQSHLKEMAVRLCPSQSPHVALLVRWGDGLIGSRAERDHRVLQSSHEKEKRKGDGKKKRLIKEKTIKKRH